MLNKPEPYDPDGPDAEPRPSPRDRLLQEFSELVAWSRRQLEASTDGRELG